jgi:hypothetical protein
MAFGHTAIHPQAIPPGEVSITGDMQDARTQPVQRARLDQALQVVQRAMVRYPLVIDPHPPPIGPAVADFLFGLPVRPPLHPPQHGQPQGDFARHRAPPVRRRSVMPLQIPPHQGEEVGIV